MPARRLTCVIWLVCIAATAVGSAQAAGPELTASAYRHRANAICAEFNRYQLPAGGTMADQLTAMVDRGRAALTELRRLRPPRSLAELQTKIVEGDSHQLALLASLVPQLRAGKITLLELGTRLHANGVAAQVNALWAKVGALDCIRA